MFNLVPKQQGILVVALSLSVTLLRAADSTNEQKLREILETKCADCHHKSTGTSEDPPLHRGVDLVALRNDTDYIIAGSAPKSPLYKRLVLPPGDKERMPKSKGQPGEPNYRPPLSSEELKAFKVWIEGSISVAQQQGAKARSFASDDLIEGNILKDLERGIVPQNDSRYLSLANCYNAKDAAGQPLFDSGRMQRAKAAVDKLLNSLSYAPEIKLTQVIDEEGIILRLRLSDYGWTSVLWEQMVGVYPFGIKTAIQSQAQALTGSKQPWMRADWFVFAASQPPLYNQFLRLPGEVSGEIAITKLEDTLGFRYEKKVHEAGTVRAGFERSGVSQGNRIIERLALASGGYFWKSYDFRKERKSLLGGDIFQSPLGPVEAGLSKNRERIFSPDGGEFIFSLPNGLQGYMLGNARGNRLDQAPKEVVQDSSRPDGVIINGVSCMSCHKDGVIVPTAGDEIAAHSKALDLVPEERATLDKLYDGRRLVEALKQDQARFTAALEKCGATGPGEPVREFYDFFKQAVSAENLIAELGRSVPLEEIASKMEQSGDQRTRDAAAAVRSKEHALPRILLMKIFPVLVTQLNLGQPRLADEHIYEEFGDEPVDQRVRALDDSQGGAPIVRPAGVRPRPIRVGDQTGSTGEVQGIKVRQGPPGNRTDEKRPVVRITQQGGGELPRAPATKAQERYGPVRVGPASPTDPLDPLNAGAAAAVESQRAIGVSR